LPKKLIGFIFIAIAASTWGSFSVVTKLLFNNAYLDPFHLTQLRAFVSGVALFIILFVANRKALKINIKSFGAFFLFGFTLILMQLSHYITVSLTDVSIASFLQYLAPAIIFVYSVIFHHETVRSGDMLTLGLAITGVIFLIISSYQQNLNMLGIIGGLCNAVTLSIYTLYSKRVADKHNPWTTLTYGLLSISLLLLLVSPPFPEIFGGFPYSIPLFLLYISIFVTIIPFGLWLLGLRFIKPHHASITSTLEPVTALILSNFLLQESLTATKLTGCLLIISSVLLMANQNVNNENKL